LFVGGLVVAETNLGGEMRKGGEREREETYVSVDAVNEVFGGQWGELRVDLDQYVRE